ncbi:MAG: DUF2911 domain-containing protein [Acidobacteriaceae bacterium]|nr:DUF2911 domain-containing protein [Acidobacteriaceae bacterium]
MTRRTVLSVCIASAAASVSALQAQRKRISPHETVSLDLGGGKTISITYGRPSLKGRPLDQLAPPGQVWRLGADEATKLTVGTNATLGGKLPIPAGSYSLFAIPQQGKWTLIVNKVADQWGAFSYDQAQDLGRIDAPAQKTAAPVEEFTIALDKQSSNTAKLTLSLGDQSVSTTIKMP